MSELKPWIGKPPHAVAPALPGYKQVGHEKLAVGKMSLLGSVLIPVWTIVFIATVSVLGGRSSYSVEFGFRELLFLVVGVIAVTVIHEIIHGLVAAVLGAKPSFGIGPGFAYTTFLEPMNKASYLAVGLTPLILMSIAAVAGALLWPAAAGWLIFAAVVNAAGAIGDLWMTVRILRSPPRAMFYDLADGFAVLVPE